MMYKVVQIDGIPWGERVHAKHQGAGAPPELGPRQRGRQEQTGTRSGPERKSKESSSFEGREWSAMRLGTGGQQFTKCRAFSKGHWS